MHTLSLLVTARRSSVYEHRRFSTPKPAVFTKREQKGVNGKRPLPGAPLRDCLA